MIRSTRAAAGAVAVLLSLALTSCGDDGAEGEAGDDASAESGSESGPPTDASVEEFCTTINDESVYQDLDPQNPDPQLFVDALQELAGNLEEVGTPADIPDDAREGFEISLEQISQLTAEDIDFSSQEDPLAADLSAEEQEKGQAFNEYEAATCSDEAPGTESPAPAE